MSTPKSSILPYKFKSASLFEVKVYNCAEITCSENSCVEVSSAENSCVKISSAEMMLNNTEIREKAG